MPDFEDGSHRGASVCPDSGYPGRVEITAEEGISLRRDQIASFVSAIYRSAGEEPPDLPFLATEQDIRSMARAVHRAVTGLAEDRLADDVFACVHTITGVTCWQVASVLLRAGVPPIPEAVL